MVAIVDPDEVTEGVGDEEVEEDGEEGALGEASAGEAIDEESSSERGDEEAAGGFGYGRRQLQYGETDRDDAHTEMSVLRGRQAARPKGRRTS